MSGDCIGYPARDHEFQLPVTRYRGTTTAYQADNVRPPIGSAALKHPELQRDQRLDEYLFAALFAREGASSPRVA